MQYNSRTDEKWDGGECAAAVTMTVQLGIWQVFKTNQDTDSSKCCFIIYQLIKVDVIIGKEDSKSQSKDCNWLDV